MIPEQVSYYFQLAQQQQQQQSQPGSGNSVPQPTASQATATATQSVATATATAAAPVQVVQGGAAGTPAGAQPQVIQLQPTQMVNQIAPPPGGIQIVQQIVGQNGEIQQIPIQLTSQQLGLIRAQMTGKFSPPPKLIGTRPTVN